MTTVQDHQSIIQIKNMIVIKRETKYKTMRKKDSSVSNYDSFKKFKNKKKEY